MTSVKERAKQYESLALEKSKAQQIPHPEPTAGTKKSPDQQLDFKKIKQNWEDVSKRDSGNGRPSVPISSDFGRMTAISLDKKTAARTSRSIDKKNSSLEKYRAGEQQSLTWTRQSSRFDEQISILPQKKAEPSDTMRIMYKVIEPLNLGTPAEQEKQKLAGTQINARVNKLITRLFGQKPSQQEIVTNSIPVPIIQLVCQVLEIEIPKPIKQLSLNDSVTIKKKKRDRPSFII